MPGRPEFSNPGMKGGNDRLSSEITTARQKSAKRKEYNQTTELPSGEKEQVEIYAPAGTIWYVRSVSFQANAPPGATMDDHRLFFLNPGGMWHEAANEGKASYNEPIRFSNNSYRNADISQEPSDTAAQVEISSNFVIDENRPLTVDYTNRTDVAQTEARNIALAVVEETIS